MSKYKHWYIHKKLLTDSRHYSNSLVDVLDLAGYIETVVTAMGITPGGGGTPPPPVILPTAGNGIYEAVVTGVPNEFRLGGNLKEDTNFNGQSTYQINIENLTGMSTHSVGSIYTYADDEYVLTSNYANLKGNTGFSIWTTPAFNASSYLEFGPAQYSRRYGIITYNNSGAVTSDMELGHNAISGYSSSTERIHSLFTTESKYSSIQNHKQWQGLAEATPGHLVLNTVMRHTAGRPMHYGGSQIELGRDYSQFIRMYTQTNNTEYSGVCINKNEISIGAAKYIGASTIAEYKDLEPSSTITMSTGANYEFSSRYQNLTGTKFAHSYFLPAPAHENPALFGKSIYYSKWSPKTNFVNDIRMPVDKENKGFFADTTKPAITFSTGFYIAALEFAGEPFEIIIPPSTDDLFLHRITVVYSHKEPAIVTTLKLDMECLVEKSTSTIPTMAAVIDLLPIVDAVNYSYKKSIVEITDIDLNPSYVIPHYNNPLSDTQISAGDILLVTPSISATIDSELSGYVIFEFIPLQTRI